MKTLVLMLVSCYLAFSSIHQAVCLRCRTGNHQQSDEQFQKIMQICRRRFLGYDRDNSRDLNARDTDSQESPDSSSDEDMFDSKFLTSAGNRYNGRNADKLGSGSSSRYNYTPGSTRNNSTRQSSASRNSSNRSSISGNPRSYYNNGQLTSGRRSLRNSGLSSRGGYGDNNYSSNRYNNNNNNNRNNNMNGNNGNNDDSSNNEREQACVTQCFFNELNLVDQKGFPERSAVIGIMTQNIQDPELRDFVEESVIECYHYLNNNNNNNNNNNYGRQEKCQFSQNLLSCLAEKGSERCEDWDDE